MSVNYQAVGWNRIKKIYDAVLAAGLALYLGVFVGVGSLVHPNATAETLLIRALGTAALLLLYVILCIGPMCRLDRRFLPLLYNRRHLGVTMFFLALAHGVFSIVQFHASGDLNPLVSVLVSNTRYNSVADFPFQALGFFALLILFLMAATSHDFWLHNLTSPVWKRLHMLVYVACALLIGHVTLGALQSETSPLLAIVLAVGLTLITALHLTSAAVERRKDQARRPEENGFVAVCAIDSIEEKRAAVFSCRGERVAVFKYDGRISAVSNVCQHQNGPFGRRQNHRWMHYLPMARLSISPRYRRLTSAIYRKSFHIPDARRRQSGLCPSFAVAPWHAGRTIGDRTCQTGLNST